MRTSPKPNRSSTGRYACQEYIRPVLSVHHRGRTEGKKERKKEGRKEGRNRGCANGVSCVKGARADVLAGSTALQASLGRRWLGGTVVICFATSRRLAMAWVNQHDPL